MNSHSLARTSALSRELLAHRVLKEKWPVTEAAEAFGISRRTAHKWLARFKAEGAKALRDRSSRPGTSPHRTASELEAWVIRLRGQGMTGGQIAAQLKLPVSTVFRILKRAGLSRLKKPGADDPVVRYERQHPGELLHIDTKKLVRIGRPGHRIHGDRTTKVSGIGWEVVHVCVDDHSRLAYVEVLPDEKAASCLGFLRRAVDWYERQGIRIQRVITDNGPCYRFDSGVFHLWLIARGIKHKRTRHYRPQTNGKAERFIQSMLREWAYAASYRNSRHRAQVLPKWLRYYNRERPHCALGGRPPISRLRPRSEQRV